MSWSRIALLLSALVASSCAVSPEDELTSQTEQALKPTCPVWGCGSNSPEIDKLGFWELHERGDANRQGFRIQWFRKYVNGTYQYFRPDVYKAELVGRNPDGSIGLPAGAVVGSELRLTRDGSTSIYRLRIADTQRTHYWARPELGRVTRTYRLEWYDETAPPLGMIPWKNVCRDPGAEHDGSTMDPFHAVLFDDDRIDGPRKRVTGHSRDWFTIGCAGSALAKQHLTGHTRAASEALGITTSLAQRTANLKMITADYCGTGEPFTFAGAALHWKDAYGWLDTVASTDVIEARWNEYGAMCLDDPRVHYNQTPLFFATWPDGDIEDDIAAECPRPPPCKPGLGTFYGAHLISASSP